MIKQSEMERLAQLARVERWKLKMCLKEARLLVNFTNIMKKAGLL